MNQINLKIIEDQAYQLHFEKALSLLNTLKTHNFNSHLLKTRLLRGCYQYTRSLQEAKLTLSLAQTSLQTKEAQLELARCLFALNEAQQAMEIVGSLYQTLDLENLAIHDASTLEWETGYLFSLIHSEIGKVDEALSIMEAFIPDYFTNSQKCIRRSIDGFCLLGDLYSYKSSLQDQNCSNWIQKAAFAYKQAMKISHELSHNSFKLLRQGLIFNNLADLYESHELWDLAQNYYEQAIEYTDQVEDEEIFDLNGYKADVYLSFGNFYSSQEKETLALQYFSKAETLIEDLHNPQQDNYLAKLYYLKGLCLLYSYDEQAAQYLNQAYSLYSLLLQKGKDKEERLANAAFYLAGSLQDEKEDLEKKKKLYRQALPIFQKVWQRNPELYLSNTASLYNEMGRILSLEQDFLQACKNYHFAIKTYLAILNIDPSDDFVLFNLNISRFNLIKGYLQDQKTKEASTLLTQTLEDLTNLVFQIPNYQEDVLAVLETMEPFIVQRLPSMKDIYVKTIEKLSSTTVQA